MRALNRIGEHNPTVAICTKNATASRKIDKSMKPNGRNEGTHVLPMDILNDGRSI